MHETLRQKRGRDFRNYEIVPTGLKVEFREDNDYTQQVIKFEIINFDEVITRKKPSPLGVMLFFSLLVNVFLLAAQFYQEVGSGALSVVSTGSVVLLSILGNEIFAVRKAKLLTGNATIPFWYFKKHIQPVDEFIGALKAAKIEYYRNTYLKIEIYEDLDTVRQRIIWLRTQDMISDDELTEWLLLVEAKRLL
jgi:hypothetical protein